MELIRDLIEWVANDAGVVAAGLFPFLLVGIVGLYLLWLIIGYLRVSQVGIADARISAQAVPLPSGADDVVEHPRGVPYCSFDGLQYPIGARFCAACERDLRLDCVNCGATLSAGDASCYRCGTPTGVTGSPSPAD
jgi:hypothetical protein